jgi:hypothetical protein
LSQRALDAQAARYGGLANAYASGQMNAGAGEEDIPDSELETQIAGGGDPYKVTGSGTSAATTNANTAAAKFEAEQQAATDAATAARTGATQQAAYLRALLGKGVPTSITGSIDAQETSGREYINTQSANLLQRLSEALGTGQQFTTQGYDTLRNYLTANPARAYAQAQRAVPTVTQNALAQYMQAQGVDPAMAQPAVDQANLAALGGATNYNQLLNVLTGAESAGQASRMSEEQMARALAGSQLQQTYGAGRAGVEAEQLSALNALATRISEARIAAENEQLQRDQAIQTALAGILGTGYLSPTSKDPAVQTELEALVPGYKRIEPPKQSAPVAKLASQVANATNKALVNRANKFIAANPTATLAQVKEEFPQLTAAAAKKKKK